MINYFSFGIKNLRRRGIRSWLTLLGIFIGITAVIALISLGSGLKAAVNSQFGVSTTQLLTVQAKGGGFGPPGSGAVVPLTKQDAEAIQSLSSVEIAIPRNIESGKLEYNNIVAFGYATNIIEGREKEIYTLANLNVDEGRLLNNGDSGKVLLGYNLRYENLNPFGKDLPPGKTVLVNDKKFEVIGILERKGSFIMDNVVWMLDSDLEKLKGYGDNVSLIMVEAKSPDLISKAKDDIEKLLRKRRDVKVGQENFEVTTAEQTLEDINSILNGIQIFIIIIASISILVGAIGIINTMTTSVLERRKEIGIMKAIGAKNKHIFYQFFVESGLMGLVGGILGILFGLFIGYMGVSALNSFLGADTALALNIPLISFSLLGSFIIGAAAGIIPAMRAANQNPVDALRG